jgi:hypothetical protein
MVDRARRMWAEWRDRRIALNPHPHEAQKWADNMKRCSCWGCSNRSRRVSGPSMSEIRRVQSMEAE